MLYANPSTWNTQMHNALFAAKAMRATQAGIVYASPLEWGGMHMPPFCCDCKGTSINMIVVSEVMQAPNRVSPMNLHRNVQVHGRPEAKCACALETCNQVCICARKLCPRHMHTWPMVSCAHAQLGSGSSCTCATSPQNNLDLRVCISRKHNMNLMLCKCI